MAEVLAWAILGVFATGIVFAEIVGLLREDSLAYAVVGTVAASALFAALIWALKTVAS